MLTIGECIGAAIICAVMSAAFLAAGGAGRRVRAAAPPGSERLELGLIVLCLGASLLFLLLTVWFAATALELREEQALRRQLALGDPWPRMEHQIRQADVDQAQKAMLDRMNEIAIALDRWEHEERLKRATPGSMLEAFPAIEEDQNGEQD